ncbi:MAG: response regulator [Elusimicrobia bacterium]|jgi:two-component system response regulator VicR|nr:response regulator [Elusimicrobiota bacterium]MBK7207937.1 response regulator [Elusimicrobiota bacterium]MBK7544703.1 response regulator [Elusimicrobiota bacterium]MBK7574235.1 response regulator [Elusimicrobiota bacterium]MBK7688825.1 response regulator [Elusimicrobiota bacterium]
MTDTKGKIVIADDEVDITRIVKRMLELEGYTVWAANDGQAALDLYRQHKPDLLILDVSMPVKDGVAVCGEVRETDNQILLLMLTGQKKEQDKVIGLGAGADDYLTKPFGEKELMARVRSLFRRLGR